MFIEISTYLFTWFIINASAQQSREMSLQQATLHWAYSRLFYCFFFASEWDKNENIHFNKYVEKWEYQWNLDKF